MTIGDKIALASLAVIVAGGIVGFIWALIQRLVTSRLDSLQAVVEAKLSAICERLAGIENNQEDHATRLRALEIKTAELHGQLNAKGCLAAGRKEAQCA